MNEVMVIKGGQSSTSHDLDTARGIELFAELNAVFPNEHIEEYQGTGLGIMEPYTHEVFNQNCMRVCIGNNVCYMMVGFKTAAAHRIFLLDTQESFFITSTVFTDEQPNWIPTDSYVIASMTTHAEFRNNAPTGLDSFKEYILTMLPALAVSELGVDPINTGPGVFYGVLVDSDDNILSVRSYFGFLDSFGRHTTFTQIMTYLYTAVDRTDLIDVCISGTYNT